MQYWHSDIKQSQACLPIQVGGLVTSFNMVVCKTFYAYESFGFFKFSTSKHLVTALPRYVV